MAIPVEERERLPEPPPVLAGRGRDRRRARALRAAVIAIPAIVGAVLAGYDLAGRSLGFDEAATFAIASQHGSALWSAIAHDGGNMSGYYLLVHALISAFGASLWVLRLPSVIAGVATAALVAAIAARLGGRRAGLVAGLLTAVSLPIVYWAQTARGYAPMLALVCGGFLAFLTLADERPSRGEPSLRWAAVAYVACMTLACYCSFVSVLVVPVQLLAVARRPAAARRLIGALAVVALLCIPLVVMAMDRGSGQLFWITRPTRRVDTQVLESLTSSGLQPSFHRRPSTYPLMVVTLVAMGALAAWTLWRRRRGQAVWAHALTVSWLVVPVVLTFIESLVVQPLWQPRNLLTSVPAISVGLGLGLTDRRMPRVAAALAVAALLVVRGIAVGNSYGVSPEPWGTVTADVVANARAGDCIAFYPTDGRSAFQYYLSRSGPRALRRAPRSILPVAPWTAITPYVEDYRTLTPRRLSRRSAGCRRMWLVSSHEGQPRSTAQSIADRARYLALDARLERRFGIGLIRDFGYASVIHVQLLPGAKAQGRSVVP